MKIFQPLRNKPIGQKIFGVILGANIFVLFVASLMFVGIDLYLFQRDFENHMDNLADMQVLNNAPAMIFDDQKTVVENLSQLKADPSIMVAAIYREDGAIFAHYGDVELLSDWNGDKLNHQNLEFSGVIYTHRDIRSNGIYLGNLVIQSDLLKPLEKRLSLYMLLGFGVFFVSLLLAALLARVFQRALTAPIHSLSHAIKQVSDTHDYTIRIEKHSEDELGILSNGFNQMLTRIQEHDLELNQHREHLELLVSKRTSELRQSRDDAIAGTRAKSMFLANMSHEIRTPLNAINGFTHLALQTNLDSQQIDYLQKIQGASSSLLRLVTDVLDFAKFEADKLDLEKIGFRLDKILTDSGALFEGQAAEKGLELILYWPNSVERDLVGDPLRLSQIINNLIANAIKFTDEGHISVTVEEPTIKESKFFVAMHICDTGIGISDDQKERLFLPFSQADSSTTRKFGGTGLGLTIARFLTEKMDGAIEVESQFNAGTCFNLQLQFDLATTAELVPDDRVVSFKDKTALLIEGKNEITNLLATLLTEFGIAPTIAKSSDQAIEILKGPTLFDLIFLDCTLPKLEGIDNIVVIRSLIGAQKPIILMSNLFERLAMSQCQTNLAPAIWLSKPIYRSAVIDVITAAFEPKSVDHQPTNTTPAIPHYSRRLNLHPSAQVLLVEDNKINQQVANELLQHLDIEPLIVSNGLLAVEKVRDQSFDLVLMDIQMPEMDGYQATQEIRKFKSAEELPIIAMTAHAYELDKQKCLAHGMNEHISKPIDPELFYQTLRRYLPEAEPRSTTVQSKVDASISIPGINSELGLKRVNNNQTLFIKLLLEFYQEHYNLLSDWIEALKHHDVTTIGSIIHGVKGVSGNIGAMELHKTAAELESSLSLNQLDPALVDRFQIQINQLLKGIEPLLSKQSVSSDSGHELDQKRLFILLDQEMLLLKQGNFMAVNNLEEIKTALGGQLNSYYNELEKAVKDFDFSTAVVALSQLKTELENYVQSG